MLNSSDKQKSKVGQQHPVSSSLPVNQSPRAGPAKADISKASNVGKLHVLKPLREKNDVTPVVKDNLSPTSSSKAVSSTLTASPSGSGSTVARGPPNNHVPDRKPVLNVLEKRPTSQAQSRNDFFNLMRRKSMGNPSSASDSVIENPSSPVDNGTAISPSFSDNHAEVEVEPATTAQAADAPLSVGPSMDPLPEEKADLTCNGDDGNVQYICNGKKHQSDPIISEEEEAAFLRSLGWEENDEEGGLTEEEISAFYKDLTKVLS